MKTPRAKARGFMLMKMTILRFAPGAIHPQAKACGLLAFSINNNCLSSCTDPPRYGQLQLIADL